MPGNNDPVKKKSPVGPKGGGIPPGCNGPEIKCAPPVLKHLGSTQMGGEFPLIDTDSIPEDWYVADDTYGEQKTGWFLVGEQTLLFITYGTTAPAQYNNDVIGISANYGIYGSPSGDLTITQSLTVYNTTPLTAEVDRLVVFGAGDPLVFYPKTEIYIPKNSVVYVPMELTAPTGSGLVITVHFKFPSIYKPVGPSVELP